MALSTLHRVFRFWKLADAVGRRSRSSRRSCRRRPVFECVENRVVLSTFFVSPTGSYDGQPAYTTIQAGINAAHNGDTIEVAPGTYHENPIVNKTLTLLGIEEDVNPTLGTRTNPANESTVAGTLSVTANDVVVNGFTLTNPSGYGIEDANGVSGMFVENNIVQNSDVGVVLFKDSSAQVVDNLILSSGGQAIDVNPGATNDLIEFNTVKGTGLDGIDLTAASGVQVSDNLIENTGGYGIGLNLANGNTLEKNTILDAGTVYKNDGGIDLDRSSSTVVAYNLIEYASADGIDVGDASGETIEYNSVYDSGTVGQGQGMLLSTVTNTTVYDNTVSDNHTDGIETALGSSGLSITYNTVNSNGGDGIALSESTGNWVQHNSLTANYVGVAIVQSTADTDWNLIQNSATDGIDVGDASGNELSYNTITGSGTIGQGQGMLLSTVTNTTVYDNTVTNNHTDGIEVAISSSGVLVSSNTVNHNGGDGIALGATSSSTVEYNNVSYNGTNIDLLGSTDNTIYDNTADNASGVGIRLDATSTGNSVTYNTMLNNGQFDAEDLSTGSGTAGTANTWSHNTEQHDNHGGGLGH